MYRCEPDGYLYVEWSGKGDTAMTISPWGMEEAMDREEEANFLPVSH
jgi:hypothetical protein